MDDLGRSGIGLLCALILVEANPKPEEVPTPFLSYFFINDKIQIKNLEGLRTNFFKEIFQKRALIIYHYYLMLNYFYIYIYH